MRWKAPCGDVLLGIVLGCAFWALCVTAGTALAQDRVNWIHGLSYVFPKTQGAAGTVLTNDGAGNLSWASVPTLDGLWSGAVVPSLVGCPTGWTRLAAANDRFLRGSATAETTAGSDTHTHTLTGATAAQTSTVTGTTASQTASISGTSGSADAAHSHGVTLTTANAGGSGTSPVVGVSVNSATAPHTHSVGSLTGGSHSHGAGTLAGGSHTHDAGTLATASASNVPAYYTVILCEKD